MFKPFSATDPRLPQTIESDFYFNGLVIGGSMAMALAILANDPAGLLPGDERLKSFFHLASSETLDSALYYGRRILATLGVAGGMTLYHATSRRIEALAQQFPYTAQAQRQHAAIALRSALRKSALGGFFVLPTIVYMGKDILTSSGGLGRFAAPVVVGLMVGGLRYWVYPEEKQLIRTGIDCLGWREPDKKPPRARPRPRGPMISNDRDNGPPTGPT